MRTRLSPPPALFAIFCIAACADYPQLDLPKGAQTARAEAPELLPLVEVLDIDVAPPQIDTALIMSMEDRVARLRARARAMRQSALTQAERTRIRTAVARLGQL